MYRIVVIFNDGAKVKGTIYFTKEECETQINAYRTIRPNDEETWGFRLEVEEV